MKSFKFKYSKSVWILLAVVLILSVLGLAWNILNLVEYSFLGAFKIVTYSLMVFMTAALTVLVLSVIFYGRYVVKKKEVITYFGLIKSRCKMGDIVQITHFKKSDKLVMYFKDEKYTVIVISPDKYDEFTATVREFNPSVIYTAQTESEDSPE